MSERLRELLANRENVHLEGHPDWDAGYVSALALVEAYLAEAAVPVSEGLDGAWRAAEAALPEGWRLYGVRYTGDEPWSVPTWRAWAGLVPYHDDENPYAASIGDTPIAALQALAAALSETSR